MNRLLFLLLLMQLAPPAAAADPGAVCLSAAVKAYGGSQKLQSKWPIAQGDFDGDGTNDTALLIIGTPALKDGPAIAVCLSSRNGEPLFIQKPYVAGELSVSPKGGTFYDYKTDTNGVYPRDGISVSCCECCGATYIYSNGQFQEIIDSD